MKTIKTEKEVKNNLPKWFKGEVYHRGDIVRNPFSGEEFELTAEELSMYDFIKGAEFVMQMNKGHVSTSKMIDEFHKGIRWFSKNNIKAYMALLD
tara:strand:- start:288 stop:572 length:285 start_codon:yes stop_codon:yes gene_type:complete